MTNSDLKVNVTGGHVNIGSINQGDHGHLETAQSTTFQAADLDTFEQSISNIAAHNILISPSTRRCSLRLQSS